MTQRTRPQKQTPPQAYPEAAEAGATGRRVATFVIACVLMAVAYWQFEKRQQQQQQEAPPSPPVAGQAAPGSERPAPSPDSRP